MPASVEPFPTITMNAEVIENMVKDCSPWRMDEEEAHHAETLAYLSSLLLSRWEENTSISSRAVSPSQEEENELLGITQQFFEDQQASRKLVDRWLSATTSAATAAAAGAASQGGEKLASATAMSKICADELARKTVAETTALPTTPKEERKTKSRSPKRERKHKKSRSPPRRELQMDAKPTDEDIEEVVARINEATALDLDEMDDFSSAWRDAQAEGRVWGGRGYGGRGVNRGLGTYRGKDAVVNGLTLDFSGKELLRETHLAISNGHRYGLCGKNGVGKSTLLRRIANGNVPGWPMHISVRMVNQEVLASSRSLRECLQIIASQRKGYGKKEALEEELAELETLLVELAGNADTDAIEETTVRMSEICEQLEQIMQQEQQQPNKKAGDNNNNNLFTGLDERAVTILRGLQFQGSMLDSPAKHLSGGWRMRVALAEALYSEPDILLLDEPTNHLDASATIFLENYIVQNNLTIVVVSHDRHFLDAVCTDMIKFENARLSYHVGNYSTLRESEEQMWSRNCGIAAAVAKKEQKAKDFIQKQRSMANNKRRDDNKLRQAKEREKKLSRIGLYAQNGQRFQLLSPTGNLASHINGTYTTSDGFTSQFVDNSQKSFGEEKNRLNFRFPSATPLKGVTGEYAPLITMEDCRFRYNSAAEANANNKKERTPKSTPSWLLQNLTLNVSVGSRIAVIGKNGSGKSTLVKLLCGELSVKGGEFRSHPNLKIAHITQHHIEHLGAYLEHTPVEYFMIHHKANSEQEVRQFLGGFGLVGPLALQLIGTLSGGQKARLAFATVMYNAPHVLILDEPTNHLDSDSLESLATAVNGFAGAVVIVSHNQQFMSQCAKEMWTVANGRVQVQIVDEELSTFDNLYGRYKDGLRKEVRLQAKKNKEMSKR